MVVPIYFRGNHTANQVDASAVQVLSAKVTSVRRLPDSAESGTENERGRVADISVQYLADWIMESGVAAERVKLSSSPLNSAILLNSLQDLCSAIAGFTPNRSDIRLRLNQLVDHELMNQMIVNKALNPATDLLPTLLFLLNSLEVHISFQ